MMMIDRYAHESPLKSIDPVNKLVFVLILLALSLTGNSWLLCLLISLSLPLVVILKGQVRIKDYGKLLLLPLTFLLMGLIVILISIQKDAINLLFYLQIGSFYLGITSAGLQMTLLLFCKALASVNCLYFLALTTPLTELCQALRRLHVPSLFVEIAELSYRFIFVFLYTSEKMYKAQSCRLGYMGYKNSLHSMGLLVSRIFIVAYHKADTVFNALEARNYQGELRTLPMTYPSQKLFISLMSIYCLAISCVWLGERLL
ncbi:MAG: cobalt ECF transporter T component CbiQ [Clostridiales bacterium]